MYTLCLQRENEIERWRYRHRDGDRDREREAKTGEDKGRDKDHREKEEDEKRSRDWPWVVPDERCGRRGQGAVVQHRWSSRLDLFHEGRKSLLPLHLHDSLRRVDPALKHSIHQFSNVARVRAGAEQRSTRIKNDCYPIQLHKRETLLSDQVHLRCWAMRPNHHAIPVSKTR